MLITDYAVRFRVTVFVLIAVLLIAGPAVYFSIIPREGAPDVQIPYVFISSAYRGVAPSEAENLITIPLEKQFKDLENVKEITSTSGEGLSMVVIEFTPEEDIDTAVQKVKDKIDLARPDLPSDLDQPVVQGLNLNTDVPVLTFAISGDEDLDRLKNIAEGVQDEVEAVRGVMQAKISGAKEREIKVDVDLHRLIAYSLSMRDVTSALMTENVTTSAGNLDTPRERLQVRMPGEFSRVMELKEVVIKIEEGRPIRLTDVATIEDGYKDASTISRINGKPCIKVNIHKRAGENTERLVRKVKEVLAGYDFPPGISTTVIMDQSDWIRMMIEDLENNIASGFLMVVLILLLFLGLRNSFFVGFAIPLSMILGLVALHSAGLTLNMIVLFSLVLTVGMLVDNAIVIVENIYRRHNNGETRMDASVRGASEVAWPVTTSTLTTLVAFWPLLFWPGIMGQFMSYLPKTAIIVLTASLFVALVMNPAVCSLFIGKEKKGTACSSVPGRWDRFVGAYEKLLRTALKHRVGAIFAGFAMLFFTVVAYGRYNSGVELFPETDPRRASIDVKYSEGTQLGVIDDTLEEIERRIAGFEDIKFYLSTAGAGAQTHLSAGAAATHIGSIEIEFVEFSRRKGSSTELVENIRRAIGSFPGAVVTVEPERMGPPRDAPVSIEIEGDDFDVLRDTSELVMDRIRDVPGLVDLKDNMEDARPELRFNIDRERAVMFGMNPAVVGGFLRAAVNGDEATKFRAGEDEFDVVVRLRNEQRRKADMLEQIYVADKDSSMIPLSSVGGFTYSAGLGQITRKDHKRMVTVSGNTQRRGSDKVLGDIIKRLGDLELPRGYSLSYAGDQEEMMEAMAFLSKAFLVALALIAMILVMQFNSILLPGIIMTSVILSTAGVMWGLLAFGMKFSVVMCGIAVISLGGVVVNNGIVLIDCIMQRKNEGISPSEAIVMAGRLRLRPVLLTAITTIAGLVPMAAGWSIDFHTFPPTLAAGSETSQWWAPMAVSVMFGLALATLLTLVQVPLMVSIADGVAARLKRYSTESRKTAE